MPYKVFLSAPTAASLKQTTPEDTFVWRTAASSSKELHTPQDKLESASSIWRANKEILKETSAEEREAQDWLFPPATFGAASQRISEMYRNVIFPEDDDDEVERDLTACEETIDDSRLEERSDAASKEESLISWPPTNPEKTRSRTSLSRSLTRSQPDSHDDSDYETSYAHTSTSSITAFPTFVINLHTLTNLSDFASIPAQKGKWTRKVNLLVAVLEVDGPDVVRIKRGPDAGKEVGVLRLVVGGEEGGICKLTAWREVADLWGGVATGGPDESTFESEGVKRGDIVYLQNILASPAQPGTTAGFQHGQRNTESHITLTASPHLSSQLHICYRTLPTVGSDRRFRPDLRLATSDPGLRKVANVARWLEAVIGLGHGHT